MPARFVQVACSWLFFVVCCLPVHSVDASEQVLRRTPIVQVVEKVAPAVVAIEAEVVTRTRSISPLDLLFNPNFSSKNVSLGSGVLVDGRGYVLTNHHVIATAQAIQLEFTDGRQVTAQLIGSSPRHDLAVLQATGGPNFPYVQLASSKDLMIGEPVIAIGNSLGKWRHTVTTGIISALHRSAAAEDNNKQLNFYQDLIQTQASINPGNSGGPLLNIYGDLIGINTAIIEHAQSIGFAIPSDKAKSVLEEILQFKTIRVPYFGFDSQELTPELAQSFGANKVKGAMVANVDNKGPGANILQNGDIIFGVDNSKILSEQELRTALSYALVGDQVALEVFRHGGLLKLTLSPTAVTPSQALSRWELKSGMSLSELGMVGAYRNQLDKQTLVVSKIRPDSYASQAGLQNGDLVRAVNGQQIVGLQAFGRLLCDAYWQNRLILLIQRGQARQQIAFPY